MFSVHVFRVISYTSMQLPHIFQLIRFPGKLSFYIIKLQVRVIWGELLPKQNLTLN